MERVWYIPTLLLAAILFAFPLRMNGQGESGDTQFQFEPFNLPNGILGNHLQCIAQDSFGFMWFGSQYGLHRWDGYHFKTFLHDPLDSTSISSSYVETIYIARDSSIWAGTFGNGLNEFDPGTEEFIQYRSNPDDPQTLSSDHITDILEDKAGNIWVATVNGVNRLDRSTGKVKRYYHDPNDPGSICYDKASCLYIDANGTLWIGTGWAWDNEGKGGLNRYNPHTDSFTCFQYNPDDPMSLIANEVFDLFEDSAGNFWVATDGDGLHLMDRERGTFDRLENTPARAGKLSAPFLPNQNEQHVKFIFEDKEQHLWVGAWQGGLTYYDPETNTIQHFHEHSDQPSTVPDNYLWDIFQSNDGTLWGFTAGTNASVFKINNSTSPFSTISTWAANDIRSFYQDEDSVLWLGTASDGLYRIDLNTQEHHVLHNDPKQWAGFNFLNEGEIYSPADKKVFDDIYRIVKDGQGYFWFLSRYEGISNADLDLMRYHPETGVLKRFIYDKNNTHGLSDKWILDILADAEGGIWIATGDGVLNHYNPRTGAFEHFRPDYPSRIYREGSTLELQGVLEVDNEGNILFAGKRGEYDFSSTGLFLYKLEPASGAFTEYRLRFDPRDAEINDLKVDDDGTIWVITFYGLLEFDPLTGVTIRREFTQLGTSYLSGLAIDEQGILWIPGSDGLVAFDPDKKTSFLYSSRAGIQVLPFFIRSIYQSGDDKIYIGGRGGAQYFRPDNLLYQSSETTPQVIISDFSLPNQPAQTKEIILWTKEFLANPKIRLKHHENIFTFRFAILSFSQPENNQHEFQLEGYDEHWRKAGLEPMAQYAKVPPGSYTFRVRAADHTGTWKEARAIQLTILPPWWGTRWAYILYSIIFVILTAGTYQFQLRRSLDLAETQRLKELDAEKTRLYNNITHEFRTPLTIITGMTAQIREHPGRWLDEGIDMIQRNSKRLLELVNQMLDLSKLESGQLGLQLQQGDIISFLKYVIKSMDSYGASMGILIHFHAEMDELIMDFDQEKMQQILINLLSNALKFTPENGHIYMSVQTANPPQTDTLVIRIRDTGKGINEEDMRHIFNRFYQIDDSSTRQRGGTGIGLALTRELVKLMQGNIKVKSKPGKGAEFIVELPIRRDAPVKKETDSEVFGINERALTPLSSRQAMAKPMNATNGKPLLLIAEDHPEVVAYLISCLEDSYRLIVAKDGREGLELATHYTPNLIISDIMMPYMDGIELTKALRKDECTSHIPIVLLTAKADIDSKLEGLEEGADAYLSKPFHKRELLTRIRNLLELRRQLQEHYLLLASGSSSQINGFTVPQTDQAEHQFVEKARAIIDEHLDDFEFTVEQFCREIGMSNSQLHRKLTAITGLSATKFIRYIRLNKAKVLLQNPNTSITAVAFDTGFNDPSYFGRVFKKEFGVTPGDWQQQFCSTD